MRIEPRRLPKMLLRSILLLGVALPAVGQGRRANPVSVDVPKVAFSAFTLPNGLRVVLHEDHSSPIVSVHLWYHVGSKNDAAGRTGLAHMFEHMLDEGTLNMPNGEFRRVVQEAGGNYAATTQNDWTRYVLNIPSHHLETALWLEAERMANLSPTLDSTRFNLEREAVRNEYRENILNVAVLSAAEAMFEAMFSEGAYRFPLMGYQSELGQADVSDLRAFYDRFYVPNNAVLVVAGDFRSAEARRMVTKHFSPIPRGRPVVQPSAVGPLSGEKRLVVEHPSGQRQLWMAWRGAKSAAPDRAAALALSSILADRLRRVLINEKRVASFLNPGLNTNFDMEESGVLQTTIVVTGSASEAERLVDSVVASIRKDGVTDAELRRWVAGYRLQTLTAMQGVDRKAELLADATLIQRDPMANFRVVERALSLTTRDVRAAALKYLTADRIVLSLVPTGKLDLISRPELPYLNATRK